MAKLSFFLPWGLSQCARYMLLENIARNERYSARQVVRIGRLTVQPVLLWTAFLYKAVGHDLYLFNMTSVRRHV